jgi:hypothetical protein
LSGIKIHFREFLYNFALKRNKLLGGFYGSLYFGKRFHDYHRRGGPGAHRLRPGQDHPECPQGQVCLRMRMRKMRRPA